MEAVTGKMLQNLLERIFFFQKGKSFKAGNVDRENNIKIYARKTKEKHGGRTVEERRDAAGEEDRLFRQETNCGIGREMMRE